MSVRELWGSFEREVVPDDAGPVQREEMRRSFYAGAFGVFCELIGRDHTEVSLKRLEQEMRSYAKTVGHEG